MDHRLVDKFVHIFNTHNFDMVTNGLKRTFPDGQTVEILKSSVFKATYPLMTKQSEHEHMTLYFYTHAKNFSIKNIDSGGNYGGIHLSVDTPEDMQRFKELVFSMGKPHWEFSFTDLINRLPRLRIKN
jgi:spore coat polysaccharide biosynthesis protein SpsF